MSDSDNSSFSPLLGDIIENNNGNQKYKDGIFRYLFKEERNFVDLYLELTG